MCGRYGLANPARVLDLAVDAARLSRALLEPASQAAARWNIAPSARVPAVVVDRDGLRATDLQWGLVPAWAKDPAIGHRLANARDDGVRHKPSFRRAFAARRALVFGDLFYEWQALTGARRKQPWCIRRRDEAPFAFAALWERWTGGPEAPTHAPPLETFTLITTRPNAVLEPIHDRMPVILDAPGCDRWLDLRTPLDDVEALLVPAAAEVMRAFPVSPRVNSPTHDDPDCITPVAPPDESRPGDLFSAT
jgi:putative SOS response-associated peptidase YedK